MSLFLRNIFCFLQLSICLSSISFGQISTTTADFKTVTAYSRYDTIYAFYQSPNPKLGRLTVVSPDTGTANFEWSKFDTIAKTFKTPFKTDINVIFSATDTLKAGGYKVRVSNTQGLDTSFVAWVVWDSLNIGIDKDNLGFVPYFRSTCDYFDLIVNTSRPVRFKYFNPANKDSFEFNNKLKFEWSVTLTQTLFATDTIDNRIRIAGEDIPTKNTKYDVKVTDKFGLLKRDTVEYKSIVTKAKIDTILSNALNSAPLHVTFLNQSENGNQFTWYLGDGDTLLPRNDTARFVHTYYAPNSYRVTLKSESLENCVDTTSVVITVAPPKLEVPNVFVPRGGQTFKFFNAVSLHYYKLSIFTRWGKKVYEETGYDSYNPNGWDGKIGNSLASEGVYFYVIEVIHFDPHPNPDLIHTNGKYSGFFYLFHPN